MGRAWALFLGTASALVRGAEAANARRDWHGTQGGEDACVHACACVCMRVCSMDVCVAVEGQR